MQIDRFRHQLTRVQIGSSEVIRSCYKEHFSLLTVEKTKNREAGNGPFLELIACLSPHNGAQWWGLTVYSIWIQSRKLDGDLRRRRLQIVSQQLQYRRQRRQQQRFFHSTNVNFNITKQQQLLLITTPPFGAINNITNGNYNNRINSMFPPLASSHTINRSNQ